MRTTLVPLALALLVPLAAGCGLRVDPLADAFSASSTGAPPPAPPAATTTSRRAAPPGPAAATPAPASAAAPGAARSVPAAARGVVTVEVTFYGGPDNDPPGSSEIAYPNGRHPAAGGTGTWADPLTLATDPRELPPGTMVYEPALRKYFVMEDDCAECIDDWGTAHKGHVDLWLAAAGSGVLACEDRLTPDNPVPIEVNPPANRPVDPRPLYTQSGGCQAPRP